MCPLIRPCLFVNGLIHIAYTLRGCWVNSRPAMVDGMTAIFVIVLNLNHSDSVSELVTCTHQILMGWRVVLNIIVLSIRIMVAFIWESILVHGFPWTIPSALRHANLLHWNWFFLKHLILTELPQTLWLNPSFVIWNHILLCKYISSMCFKFAFIDFSIFSLNRSFLFLHFFQFSNRWESCSIFLVDYFTGWEEVGRR